MELEPYRPYYLVGPTGSGKSAVALALAKRIGGEIVNADAYQLYSELRIVTARPDVVDEAEIRHHLYGVLSTAEVCSAAIFTELAQPVIREISAGRRVPIVVGGSGLYIKALTHGLLDVPASDPEIRAGLDRLSAEQLLDRLRQLDPVSADRIDPLNRRFVQRAVEITLTSGRPASEARKAWEVDPPGLRGARLNWPRPVLNERINARVVKMISHGAIHEVRAVETWSETSAKAIGVADIRQYLNGILTRAETVSRIQNSTRQYGKRQHTWFQREKWLRVIDLAAGDEPDEIADRLAASLTD